MRVRKEESRIQGHFLWSMDGIIRHHEKGLPLCIMQQCISSLANGDYKAVVLIMAIAHLCKSPVSSLTLPPPHTPSYSHSLLQDVAKRHMLIMVWPRLHPDTTSMWVMSLVRTNVARATYALEKYVGMMKTFSRELVYTDAVHEVCSGGDVIYFHGDPFTGDILNKTLKSNRKYQTRIGERHCRCISTRALLPTSTTSTHIHPCTWCISTHGGAHPPIHPSTHFDHPPTSIHPCIHPSTHPPIHLHPPIHPSTQSLIYLYIHSLCC